MMGALQGWVTDPAIWESWKPSAARNAMLRMLGNGVVTQQALLALSIAWSRLADVREAAAA